MWRLSVVCAVLLSCVAPLAGAAGWGDLEKENAPAKLDIIPWRDWLVEIGPDHNTFPGGGNDPFNYFGAMEGAIDDCPDSWDVVDPFTTEYEFDDHLMGLRFVGDQWGDNPTYPEDPRSGSKGLCWDVREPYAYGRGYKIWKAEVITWDAGYTYDLVWNLDPYPGSGLAYPPWFGFRLDMDGSFADEPPGSDPRWYDPRNYEIDLRPDGGGPEYVIEGLPQTGGTQVWYIIAGFETQPIGVPEPSVVGLAPLILGAAAPMLWRSKKRR